MKAESPKVATSIAEKVAEIAFWPARILLLALIFACPWYYGSVTWQAQAYYLPAAALVLSLAVVGSLLRREKSSNPLIWCLASLLALAIFQTVELPEWLWQRVSASAALERTTSKIEAEFLADSSVDPASASKDPIKIEEIPRTLSIHWVQTRASIATFAVALACLLSSGILFRTRTWEVVLLCVLAVSGLSIAIVGLVQSVAWNKWTLLPMPTATYFATFVSRNSAPQFLAIGLGGVLGLLAWWNGSKTDEADKKYYVRYPAVNAIARFRRRLEELVTDLDAISLICVFSATLIFVAVLAAGSRGGILSCLASAVLTLCVSLGTQKSYARSVGLVTIMGCGAMLLLTTLELDSAIWERMDSVNEEAYKLDNGRITVWQMILSRPSCWLPGCGLGNFHFAILPTYLSEPTAWFYHAENIYLELLMEFGLVGFAIGMAGLAWLVIRIRWCVVNGRRAAPTFVATTLTVSAVALQSLVDFSLIIPAVCFPLAALVGCFLGRSYCTDYGRKPKHGEHRKSDRRKTSGRDQGKSGAATGLLAISESIGLLSLILFSVWLGAKPLAGFAFAEQLSSQLSQLEKPGRDKTGLDIGEFIEAIDHEQMERFADHPEVNLQIGRLLQSFSGEMFATNLKWPLNVTAAEKVALSEPANIAAAYRAKDDPRMLELRELSKQLPQQIESLRRSAVRMAAAASMCCFDWRSGLGVIRSDLNWFDPQTRARNYARLLQLTGQSRVTPASVGAAALLAGEKKVAYRFLHDYLERIPSQVVAISSSIIRQMPQDVTPAEAVRELQLVLPESLLSRAEVAEDFSRKPDLESISNELASGIDFKDLVQQAEQIPIEHRSAKPWLLVAWLAKDRGDLETQFAAIRNALSADPMNHALRFSFGQTLLENGRQPEALDQVKRASQQAPENRVYKEFLKENF